MADLIERARAEVDLRRMMFGEDRTKWSRADRMTEELLYALEAAREDACVALVADIRFACGDNGNRMQPELVEFIRELAADAERYRWLVDSGKFCPAFGSGGWGLRAGGFGRSSKTDLDAAIDQARGKGGAE